MLNFDELLKRNLPSKVHATLEGVGCGSLDEECNPTEACKKEGCGPARTEGCNREGCNPMSTEGCKREGCNKESDDYDDDLSDIDLDDIDDEDIDDVTEDELAAIDDDEVDDVELTDDEEDEADQNMAIVATPVLLDDELKEESVVEEFMNEFPTMVAEGFLLESDLDEYLDTDMDSMFTEAKVFASKTRVQLNEKDRRKQLFEIGVQASARAHNDPVYWKLQKVYKLERIYKAKLRQKYRGEALKRVKAYVKRLKASSSGVLKKLGEKITGKG